MSHIVNWRGQAPCVAHGAGIDWPLLQGQALKKEGRPSACMDTMMYVTRAMLTPGLEYHAHKHDDHEEVYYIISGAGEIDLDGVTRAIRDGDAVFIPIGCTHAIRNTGDDMVVFLAFAAQK